MILKYYNCIICNIIIVIVYYDKFDCTRNMRSIKKLRQSYRVRYRSYQNDWSIGTVFSHFIDPSGSHTVIRWGAYDAEAN